MAETSATDRGPATGDGSAAPGGSAPDRAGWMGLFARADAARLRRLLDAACAPLGGRPAARFLRPPEIGAVMLQGRAGGTGAAFNQGEMTVTRAVIVLADGTEGHAWVPGRDRDHAADAALADALMQRPETAAAIATGLCAPLAEAERRAATRRREKAAATRVDFFTMVRGED